MIFSCCLIEVSSTVYCVLSILTNYAICKICKETFNNQIAKYFPFIDTVIAAVHNTNIQHAVDHIKSPKIGHLVVYKSFKKILNLKGK